MAGEKPKTLQKRETKELSIAVSPASRLNHKNGQSSQKEKVQNEKI